MIYKDNIIIENIDTNNNKIETPKCSRINIDKVLIEDILYKKSPWLHYNKRYVKLYSKGHLDCYDISTKILKGIITINASTKAYPLDDFRFKIVSQNKTYFFKHISKRIADNWVEQINNIVFDKIRNSKKSNY